jgi:hypothetical protein
VHVTFFAKWYLLAIFLALFLPHAVGQSAADSQVMGTQSAGSCATSALFTSTMPPESRQRVLISGENLAATSTSDVESMGKDAAGIETKTAPALEVKNCNALQCTARIDHGPDYKQSFVRIKCQNGTFSPWLEIHR